MPSQRPKTARSRRAPARHKSPCRQAAKTSALKCGPKAKPPSAQAMLSKKSAPSPSHRAATKHAQKQSLKPRPQPRRVKFQKAKPASPRAVKTEIVELIVESIVESCANSSADSGDHAIDCESVVNVSKQASEAQRPATPQGWRAFLRERRRKSVLKAQWLRRILVR